MTDNMDKYSYDRFDSKGQRVGQAVTDIMATSQAPQTVEETLEAMAPQYMKDLEQAIKDGHDRYEDPYHVLVFSNKEMWAVNMMRNWFVPRQTCPSALDMITEYPHKMKTLYRVKFHEGTVEVLWALPGLEDCKSIIRNPALYDPQLVQWIEGAFNGTLDSKIIPSQITSPSREDQAAA